MIFVDSSCWFASLFEGDRHHARAKALLNSATDGFVTSDHVLVETWLLTHSRFNFHYAQTFWRSWAATGTRPALTEMADLILADEIAARFSDQTFSIVDRTSFAVMERLGISRVISFDDDFVIYRFGPDKSRAFEVLR